jgi:hypothetical protein
MFSKISRYRKLPDVVSIDPKGRALESKSLRLLPAVSGSFRHTVEASDRLDHLAFKYYNQPRNWWRIADANPAFLCPHELLGQAPWTTSEIPLSADGQAPAWSELLRLLGRTPGVDEVVLGTAAQPVAEPEILQGNLIFDIGLGMASELDASAEAQQLTLALSLALAAEGLVFAAQIRVHKPDAATWQITDLETREIYTLQLFVDDGLLNVYQSQLRHHWSMRIVFNNLILSIRDILDIIEAQGFVTGTSAEVGRLGKAVVIPPRAV